MHAILKFIKNKQYNNLLNFFALNIILCTELAFSTLNMYIGRANIHFDPQTIVTKAILTDPDRV